MRILTGLAGGLAGLALTAAGMFIVPRAVGEAVFLLGPRDEVAAADHALGAKRPEDVAQAIQGALGSQDEELARSLADVANAQGIPLSPALLEEIARAEEHAATRKWSNAWNGFLTGEAPTGAAFGGSLAADLVGYGDLRDLYGQALNYLDDRPVDKATIGFAAAGLALTAVTIASLGSTSPERGGLSILKAAKRTGKLSPMLAREVSVLAADAVDTRAFGAAARAIGALDLAGARAAATAIVRPQALRTMGALGADVSTIGSRLGYRGTLQSLALAKSPKEISSIAKLTERFGPRTRGVLALLGGAVLTAVNITISAAAWTFTAMVWLGFAALFVLRSVVFLIRSARSTRTLIRRLT